MIFRRVNGHIVPINENKKKKEGGAAIVTGVVAGTAAGKRAGTMMHEAALAENAAREHTKRAQNFKSAGPLFETATAKSIKSARKAARLSNKQSVAFEKNAFRIRGAGIAASAGLVTAGVDRLMGDKNEKNKKKRAVAVGSIGTAVGFGVHSAYSHSVGLRGAKKFSHAFKRALKI